MAREKTIPQRTAIEEIQSYTHRIGEEVSFLVGTGSEINGKFVFDVPQRFETFSISGSDYTELLSDKPVFDKAKPKGVFSVDHLWHFVDKHRGIK